MRSGLTCGVEVKRAGTRAPTPVPRCSDKTTARLDDLPSYLEELEELLLDQPDECMLLTQLDGFFAGLLVSPNLRQVK